MGAAQGVKNSTHAAQNREHGDQNLERPEGAVNSAAEPGHAANTQQPQPEAADNAAQNPAQTVSHDAALGLCPNDIDFLPPFLQSLVTLFRLLGKRISGNQLLAALGNSAPTVGASQRAASSLGLESRLVHRPKLADISCLLLPCLLVLKDNKSCVLVEKVSAGESCPVSPETKKTGAGSPEKKEASLAYVRVVYPELGHEARALPLAEVEKEYSGYVLFGALDPHVDERVSPVANDSLRHWFWDVVRHYWPLYGQVALASIVINFLALIGPLFIMNVYDRVVPNLAMETLWVLGVGALAGYVFEFALRLLRSSFTDTASRNIDIVVNNRLMQKILRMRLVDRPSSSGALLNNLREFEGMREFFSASTLLALVDFPFLVFFLGIVFMLGGYLVIIPLVALVLLLLSVLLMQRAIKRTSLVAYQGNVERNAHLVEMINGMEAIKMAAAENRMLQIWEKIVGYSARNAAKSKSLSSFAVNMAMFVTHVVSVALIIAGVYLIAQRSLTVGGLIACNMLTGRAMGFMMQLASLLTRWEQARIALRVLNNLMALPVEGSNGGSNVDFGYLAHNLELEHVTFTYKGAHLPVLRDINLSIWAGEKVGVIGNMGSGKSTLSALLAGLYEPSAGAVKFGGVDLRQLDITELRTRMGYLAQNPMLFYGSVRDNIALGVPSIQDQLILRAAWISGATEFVSRHPAGFAMNVGENGQNLSGGQRQSVAMARALLHDPDVLIFDEPTSNIDGLTESLIKKRLRDVIGKKTLIINMHRMSLLDLVDRVIVLQDGGIVADGPKNAVMEWLRGPRK